MSEFDFTNAQLPQLLPLQKSFTVDDTEAALKQLFLDLFTNFSNSANNNMSLAQQVFDVNVMGMAHLGSLALVQRFVNFDGLVMLPGATDIEAMRYIYRAWRQQAKRGRGLFFLRIYLQVLFPGAWTVEQQMAPINQSTNPYPTALYDRTAHGADVDKFLTSRVKIYLDATASPSITGLISIISAVIPAKFVPKFFQQLSTDTGLRVACVFRPIVKFKCQSRIAEPSPVAVTALIGNPSIVFHGSGSVLL